MRMLRVGAVCVVGQGALGFELRDRDGAWRAKGECGSSVVLISELVLPSGLLRNGLQAALVSGVGGARGAPRRTTFT